MNVKIFDVLNAKIFSFVDFYHQSISYRFSSISLAINVNDEVCRNLFDQLKFSNYDDVCEWMQAIKSEGDDDSNFLDDRKKKTFSANGDD